MKYFNIKIPLLLLLASNFCYSKPIFIGDSLTYQIALSYKKYHPVDVLYLEGSGLQSNKKLDWQSYIKTVPLEQYDTVYIVLGTNDFISKNEIINYKLKAKNLIHSIKNKNTSIVWLLPPELKNEYKNTLLKNTRDAIQYAGNEENIKIIDMRHSVGMRYIEHVNNIPIRTKDGIHLTKYGGDEIAKSLLATK